MKRVVFACIVVFCLVNVVCLSGCTRLVANLSIASTSPDLNFAAIPGTILNKSVEATEGRLWFLFIPLGSTPSLQEAIQNAMNEGKGDYLANCRVYRTAWSILLFSYANYEVITDVGNSKAARPPSGPTVIITPAP